MRRIITILGATTALAAVQVPLIASELSTPAAAVASAPDSYGTGSYGTGEHRDSYGTGILRHARHAVRRLRPSG